MAAAFIWAVGLTDCVIFATLQNLFLTATVQDDFSVWMSRIYYKWGRFMKSLVIKRSVVVAGHKTSVSLEDAFWDAMQKIAMAKGTTRARLIGQSKRSASPRTCPQRFVYSCSRTIRLTHGDETSEPARPADDARQET